MNCGFKYCRKPFDLETRKHTSYLNGFKEDTGKWESEVHTEEQVCLVRFLNGKNHVLTKRYIEFRHDPKKNPDNKTVIDWHWVDFPSYYDEDDILGVEIL